MGLAAAGALILGCAHANADVLTNIQHDISPIENTQWSLVSMAGLDEKMAEYYAAGNTWWEPRKSFEGKGVAYEDFVKISGGLLVKKDSNPVGHIRLLFGSCNGVVARYSLSEAGWIIEGHGQTTRSCQKELQTQAGETVLSYAPMITDRRFMAIAPDVAVYRLAEKGQILLLVDENNAELARFSRVEAAQ